MIRQNSHRQHQPKVGRKLGRGPTPVLQSAHNLHSRATSEQSQQRPRQSFRSSQWAAELRFVWAIIVDGGCLCLALAGARYRRTLVLSWIAAVDCWIILHLRDAWRAGRPGYPTKMGVFLLCGGVALSFDVMYREEVAGQLYVHPIAPMVAGIGAVVMLGRILLFIRPPLKVRLDSAAVSLGGDSAHASA